MTKKLTSDQYEEIRRLRSQGQTYRAIGDRFNISGSRAQQIVAGPHKSDLREIKQFEAFTRLAALEAEVLWRQKIPMQRIAALGLTSVAYVKKYLRTKGSID